MNGKSLDLTQEFFYYEGFVGDNEKYINRSSGAYIFRPVGKAMTVNYTAEYSVFIGNLVSEVHQQFSDWVSQVVRVYAKLNLIEFQWLVGPIPLG